MKIGLTYNLKTDIDLKGLPDDAQEEFDSPETVKALSNVLADLGHECVKLGFGKPAIERLREKKVDFVFNIAEGFAGRSREAQMPALLEMFGIPYTGPDPLAAALTLDKVAAKRLAIYLEVNTPSYFVIQDPVEFKYDILIFPAILKPAYEGSSKGIRLDSKVDNVAEAKAKAAHLFETYGNEPVIAEQFIRGREVTVAVIGNKKPKVLGIMEIKPRTMELEDFIYSLEVKRNYTALVDYACPAELTTFQGQILERSALVLYHAFGCRDIARFDFRIDEYGTPQFLECNPLPGLNPVSGDIVIMSRLLGIPYHDLIKAILEAALERCKIQYANV